MAIEKILYVSDNPKNYMAAMDVDPRIDFVQNIEVIQKSLGGYSCLISDLKATSYNRDMGNIRRAINEGILPYVATTDRSEGGVFTNRVKIFDSESIKIFDNTSRDKESFWRELIPYLESNQDIISRDSLRNVKEISGIVPDFTLQLLMDMYSNNYRRD